MRIFLLFALLAFAGLVVLLPDVEARPLSKNDLRKIQRAAAEYVRESNPKARDKPTVTPMLGCPSNHRSSCALVPKSSTNTLET